MSDTAPHPAHTDPARTDPASAHAVRGHSRVALLVGCVLALLALAALPAKDALFLDIAEAAQGSALASTVSLVAKAGVLVVVATAGAIAVWTFRRRRRSIWTLVVAGVGVVAAYALSEGIKLLVTEDRPCRVLDVATVLVCPEAGDWSWPSNHATIAAAFVTACALVLPRSLWLGAPMALLIALSRVGAGVHYVHDVLSGLALGTVTVALAVTVAAAATTIRGQHRGD